MTVEMCIRDSLFALDDIYEQIYFIPLIKEAQIQVRLLVNPEEDRKLRDFLCTALWKVNGADGALDDGVDCNGNPVYFCYDLELWRLKRVKGKIEREGRGIIYCFDYQEEALGAYMGGEAVVKGVVRERAVRYLEDR